MNKEQIIDFVKQFGVVLAIPLVLVGLLVKDRNEAEKRRKRTAKARRARLANTNKKGKKRVNVPKKPYNKLSKAQKRQVFLDRMAKGRRKAAKARK